MGALIIRTTAIYMFQFVHVNSYSRTLSKKAQHAKWTAKDVVAEATRDPGAIPHIDNPEPHKHVYGQPIEQLLETLDTWAEGTKDAKGRATRKDAVCLLAGVFSAPSDTPPEQWEQIKADSIAWAILKYGDRLKTVIEHQDEAHPHCHFYVVPLPGETFETVHEGRAAVKAFVAEGGDKKKTNAVYRNVMRGFQNEYYEAVGAPNGMTRIGPGKRRLTREAWRMEQQQAEAIAAQHDKASRLLAEANTTITEATAKGSEIEGAALQKVADLQRQAEQFKAKVKAEANAIKDQAIKAADAIEARAEKSGFERGLDAFGALPWVQKASQFLSKVTKERDGLKVERDQLKEQLEKTGKEHEGLKVKAKRWFEAAKELSGIKPKFEKALEDVEVLKIKNRQVDDLERKNSELDSKLDKAKGRIEHLGAVVEALSPEPEPLTEKERQLENRKNARFYGEDETTLG